MSKAKIKPVQSNEDKRKTYASMMQKYSSAIEKGFFGEAELIVYAYIEDRLRSFIYYSDGLDYWNCKSTNDNIASICGEANSINNMSTKLDLIKIMLNLNKDKEKYTSNAYALSLIRVYKAAFNVADVKRLLKKIDKWREYRNEIVHALLNKNLDDLHSTYEAHVKDGFKLARELDNYVRLLKKA